MKLLFLDIDGVLNDHKKNEYNNYCGIDKEKINLINRLLLHFPDLQIVISSAWRYLTLSAMNMRGLEYLFLTYGLIENRVIGHTVFDEYIFNRPDQIEKYIMHHTCDNFVILDDLNIDFGPNLESHLVRIDGSIGLVFNDLQRIIKILNPESVHNC